MAQVITLDNARDLGLPGRASKEIVSSHVGAKAITFRLVELAVPAAGEEPRGPHVHHGFEECMHIVAGTGELHAGGNTYLVNAGDTVLVPSDEVHVTRNTGDEPLVLMCFFPINDIVPGTKNL